MFFIFLFMKKMVHTLKCWSPWVITDIIVVMHWRPCGSGTSNVVTAYFVLLYHGMGLRQTVFNYTASDQLFLKLHVLTTIVFFPHHARACQDI